MKESNHATNTSTNMQHNNNNKHSCPEHLKIFRKRLCQKIIDLHRIDTTGTRNVHVAVDEELEPIILAAFDGIEEGIDDCCIGKDDAGSLVADDQTPLMVTCDSGGDNHCINLSCLRYFATLYSSCGGDNQDEKKELYDNLLGDCLCSCATDGNNQAIHYFAMSMSHSERALEYLGKIFIHQHHPQGLVRRYSSLEEACLILLSQVNDHGDTPLMMATAKGKASLMKCWIQLLLWKPRDGDGHDHDDDDDDGDNGDDVFLDNHKNKIQKDRIRAVNDLLTQQNNSKDTVLSLAYGYGHYEIVKLLITDWLEEAKGPLVQVQYHDVQRCKALLDKLNFFMQKHNYLSSSSSSSSSKVNGNVDEFLHRKTNIQKCHDLLSEALAKHADQVSNLLLEQVIQEESQKNSSKKKKKSKTKNKHDNHQNEMLVDKQNDKTSHLDVVMEPMTVARFVTMQNGTVVSSSDHVLKSVVESGSSKFTKNPGSTFGTKPINHLLRERCNDTWNRESEELLEALCLDASMLLLSPQSMALNLSPCQLETVETVLKLQLKAVETAKNIHARLMTKK
jgi:hypothetical protein